jgi:hypothetical protein
MTIYVSFLTVTGITFIGMNRITTVLFLKHIVCRFFRLKKKLIFPLNGKRLPNFFISLSIFIEHTLLSFFKFLTKSLNNWGQTPSSDMIDWFWLDWSGQVRLSYFELFLSSSRATTQHALAQGKWVITCLVYTICFAVNKKIFVYQRFDYSFIVYR